MNHVDETRDTDVRWDPPAGGSWQLETVHVAGAQPRLFQERAPAAFKEGFQLVGRRYGMPIDSMDLRFVNEHCYVRVRPVGAPEPKPGKVSKAPPALVLKVLARVHPELRRRAKAARRALAARGVAARDRRLGTWAQGRDARHRPRAPGRADRPTRRRSTDRARRSRRRSLPARHHPAHEIDPGAQHSSGPAPARRPALGD